MVALSQLNYFVDVKMHPVYFFMLWFVCSLIGIFFLLTLIGNQFLQSFVIAVVLSIVAVRDKQ